MNQWPENIDTPMVFDKLNPQEPQDDVLTTMVKNLVVERYNQMVEDVAKEDLIEVGDVSVSWVSPEESNWRAEATIKTNDEVLYRLTHDGFEKRTVIIVYERQTVFFVNDSDR